VRPQHPSPPISKPTNTTTTKSREKKGGKNTNKTRAKQNLLHTQIYIF